MLLHTKGHCFAAAFRCYSKVLLAPFGVVGMAPSLLAPVGVAHCFAAYITPNGAAKSAGEQRVNEYLFLQIE